MAETITATITVSGGDTITATLNTAARGPAGSSGGGTFLSLTDTPSSYTGQGGKVAAVNAGGTALEFISVSGTGTVTSVAITGTDGIDVDSGSPITAAGTITLGVNASTLKTHLSLNNVDNTSNATERAATATLTNKTLTAPVLTAPVLGTPASGDFSSGTFTWPTFNQSTTGNAATVSTINGKLRNGAGTMLTGSGTTLNPYRVTAIPVTGETHAVATIGFTGLPTASQTLTINSRVYTFQASAPLAESDILIGADAAETIQNAITAINNPSLGTANADVFAEYYSATEIRLVAIVAGAAGNSITLAEAATNVDVSDSVLSGGGELGSAAFTATTAYAAASHNQAISTITGLGTGIATALAVNTGSAGAPVLFNGAGGTPSSLTLTSATGLPLSTGVTGDLPFANFVQASAASKVVGRGSASGAGDFQELTVGAGMAINTTTIDQYDVIGIACSDMTTVLTTGEKVAFDMPFNFSARRVYASLAVAPTVSALTVDIEDEGTSLLNAVLSIATTNNNAETSTFASAASSYALTKGDRVTIDIDSVGSSNAGLVIFIEGFRT